VSFVFRFGSVPRQKAACFHMPLLFFRDVYFPSTRARSSSSSRRRACSSVVTGSVTFT